MLRSWHWRGKTSFFITTIMWNFFTTSGEHTHTASVAWWSVIGTKIATAIYSTLSALIGMCWWLDNWSNGLAKHLHTHPHGKYAPRHKQGQGSAPTGLTVFSELAGVMNEPTTPCISAATVNPTVNFGGSDQCLHIQYSAWTIEPLMPPLTMQGLLGATSQGGWLLCKLKFVLQSSLGKHFPPWALLNPQLLLFYCLLFY